MSPLFFAAGHYHYGRYALYYGRSTVIAEDTDIFILLLRFCHLGNISCNVLMVSPIQGRAVVDINASAEKHRAGLPDLLAGHCLSDCDTVASHFGIGKGIALRSATHRLDLLGNTGDQVQHSNIVEQATQFMLACYGQRHANPVVIQSWQKQCQCTKTVFPASYY